MIFKRKKDIENNNFWISYADLMAGLLFVFILLIGAIVVKSVVLKTNLSKKSISLKKTKKELDTTNQILDELKTKLYFKNNEVKNLNKKIDKLNASKSKLKSRIIVLTSDMKKLIEGVKSRDENIKNLKNKVLIISTQLKDVNQTIAQKDIDIANLLNKLQNQDVKYEELVASLERTKNRIKNLTGIKVKIITILKKALGDRVKLDKSGALRLSSKILFDKDKAVLKDGGKDELRDIFTRYIQTLIVDPQIKPYLEKIVIEGHTDSDGEFLYNLNLSQQRAYSVMNYLLSLPVAQKLDIKKYILASGRSFLDPVLDEKGKEDKEASRRIEIKFLLKNDTAMKEIEAILDEK